MHSAVAKIRLDSTDIRWQANLAEIWRKDNSNWGESGFDWTTKFKNSVCWEQLGTHRIHQKPKTKALQGNNQESHRINQNDRPIQAILADLK